MTVYEPRKFPDQSHSRLAIWVVASLAAHTMVIWVSGLTASNFQIRSAPLQVELRTVVIDSREPLAISGPPPDLDTAAQSPDQTPMPSTPTLPNLPQPADKTNAQSLPLNIYYASSEVDVRAEPLNEVDLIYPLIPYQQRIFGTVRLNIFVNEQGKIDKVAVVDAKPPGVFDEAALRAVVELKFSPAIKNGFPVKNRKVIEVKFDPYEKINTP